MKKNFVACFRLLPVIILAACANQQQSAGQKPVTSTASAAPNVIVIVADDLGYNDVGFNGSKDIPTPQIDRIAHNGVMFTNGYVSYAVCGPSRAGLITGRYQDRFGFSRNPLFAPKDPTQGLPLSEETLADVLKKANYRTMAIGKWHLGAHPSQRPLKRGFDEFFGFLTGGHNYFPQDLTINDISGVNSQYAAYKTKLLKNDTRVNETEYLTDAFSREAVQFIERNAQTPFFLYLAYNAPHAPLQATQKYLDRFPDIKNKQRRTYAAMVSAMDDGVGQVLNTLERLKLDRNTIVVFLSDNGGPEQHNGSDNGLLREGKGTLYEGGVRVPFAMQWPGVIPQGMVYDKPVISLDIFATAIAPSRVIAKNELDGVNIIPYLTNINQTAPHPTLYWRQFDKNSIAIRDGNYKYVTEDGVLDELFNLDNDISEAHPLTDSKKLQALKDLHKKWDTKNSDPVFLGLSQDGQYNKEHPDRFKNGEKY
ncbi:MAG: sulfatase-like hydrolase/transferase [Niabella sp.]